MCCDSAPCLCPSQRPSANVACLTLYVNHGFQDVTGMTWDPPTHLRLGEQEQDRNEVHTIEIVRIATMMRIIRRFIDDLQSILYMISC